MSGLRSSNRPTCTWFNVSAVGSLVPSYYIVLVTRLMVAFAVGHETVFGREQTVAAVPGADEDGGAEEHMIFRHRFGFIQGKLTQLDWSPGPCSSSCPRKSCSLGQTMGVRFYSVPLCIHSPSCNAGTEGSTLGNLGCCHCAIVANRLK